MTSFWNLPDEVSGAWAERRRLATALRALNALCVTSDAPEADLAAAVRSVEEICTRLQAFPRRSFKDVYARNETHSTFADRGALAGRSSPLAPPIGLRMEGEDAVAEVTFGPLYEGAPGFVHGGFVAAAFDQLFGFLLVSRELSSLTASLTVRYLAPTPVETPLRLEASLARVEGRRRHVAGRLLARGRACAEAEALFIEIDPDKMRKLFDADVAAAAHKEE